MSNQSRFDLRLLYSTSNKATLCNEIPVTIFLSNFESLVKGTDFYITQSNTCIPHSALKGATPKEIITGSWTEEKKTELIEKIAAAGQLSIETNKAVRCTPCLA